ncbi:Outer dense fiber protein 3-like protein 2 [Chytriomyces hyalinus]|uniref:Uncharacterized protein n=1 Tax=Chytriomyces confervae TaxID=246404 RepID=A0A507FN82_9FUNG|nr:Outer dense fiber protein 3-like protein 2 [Chytriomyces hyalinus]KAJ3408151.1 Outer dense fiber protein 3-like protein 2 [Chytriomyces hyalinus]TPX76918.1 hypothetical protein CcCBS67573_g01838 [Chytriomyces confervae]
MTDIGHLPRLPNNGGGDKATKEIPIAARSKGPGPAAYTLPSTIGLHAKTGKRAPAYSFGMKLNYEKQNAASETPGPNAFFPQTTRTGASKGPAFSLQGGFKKGGQEGNPDDPTKETGEGDTPGPGKYNPTYIPTKEPKAPAYSMGGRRNNEKLNINPGPAEYLISSTLGLHPAITMPAAAAYTIKPPRPMKLESFSPGPAAYAALDPSKIKKSAPAYSLGSRWHHENAESPFSGLSNAYEVHTANGALVQGPTPGPGHYSPSMYYNKEATPSFSFRCKHSEYELFVPDTSEGEFIF